MITPNLLLKTLIVFCFFTSMVAGAQDHFLFPESNPTFIFAKPECLPNCTAADRGRLTEQGVMETPIIDAIKSAKESVYFSQFTFSRKPIFESLLAAYARGVKVTGIVDRGQFSNLDPLCKSGECVFPAPFSSEDWVGKNLEQRLTLAITSELFNKASNSEKLALLFHQSSNKSRVLYLEGQRLVHNKFVLVDQEVLVSGSGNWSSTAVSVNLENLSILRKSEYPKVVGAFPCLVEALLAPAPERSKSIGACQDSENNVWFAPVTSKDSQITDVISANIDKAETSIDVAMHHLVHPQIVNKLSEAAKKGVMVRIVTDDDTCSTPMSSEMNNLVAAGAQIRYVPTSCSMFQLSHNKFGIFDSKYVINGSGNWSKAGLERNFENFIGFQSEAEAAYFKSLFDWSWGKSVDRSVCECAPGDATCLEAQCGNRPRG